VASDAINDSFFAVYALVWAAVACMSGASATHHAMAVVRLVRDTSLSLVICLALKAATRIRRPNGKSRDSFPSGHATLAATLAGHAATVACAREWGGRGGRGGRGWWLGWWLVWLLSGWTALVALARVVGRFHRVVDVVVGVALGVATPFATAAWSRRTAFR